MTTSRQKGNHYENRSVAYLMQMGYVCEKAPARIVMIAGRPRAMHYDFYGCVDIIAVKNDHVAFVQVKLGKSNVASGRRKLEDFIAPYGSKFLHIWVKGAHEPAVEMVP
jgi:hypothetical protein